MSSNTADVETRAARRSAAQLPPAGGRLSHKQVLTILAGLMMGMFLAALDQTIVSSAIRVIGDDLHGLSIQAWVTTAYLITSTISTPLYGKLSDLYGRKPFFLLAISVFIIGSAACTFSTSMYMLAAFRAFQGLGAGGLFSLALAIIADIVSPRERARYQGYFLAVFGTSSVLGPVIGGFFAGRSDILSISGWRWVFLVNVPIGIAALVVVWHTLNIPHTRRDHRIDWKGAIALVICLVPLLIVAEQGREWGWASDRAYLCYGVGVVGLLLFIFAESRIGLDALIPLHFFRNRTFTLTSVAGVIVGLGMFGMIALLPLYLQIVKGASPTKSGLLTLPLTAGIMLSSVIAGQTISRTGHYKFFPVVGSLMMIVGFLLMHTVGADTAFWQIAIFSVIFGFGLGFIMQPITLAVQNAMPPKDVGVATSSVTFFRQMGATIGTAVFLSILFSTVGGNIKNSITDAGKTAAFRQALHDPHVLHNPGNAQVLQVLNGKGDTSGMLNDTSFLNSADHRLAHPFFVGFSDSMSLIFLIGAAVMVLGVLFLVFIPAIPLRMQSGLEAQHDSNNKPQPSADDVALEPAPGVVTTDATIEPPGPAVEPEFEPQRELVGAAVATADSGLTVRAALSDPDTPADWESDANGRHSVIGPNGQAEPVRTGGTNGAPPPRASAEFLRAGGNGSGGGGESGPTIRGRVRQPNAAPVAAAALTLIDMAGRQVGRDRSDAEGRYQLSTSAPGQYVLIAHATGHQPHASTVELAVNPTDFDVILSGSAALLGTVRTSGGEPVASATVTVTDSRGEVITSRTTDADGRYELHDLVAGDYTLVVSAGGFRPIAALVAVPASGKAEHDIELVGGANLQGTARAGETPLSDARVSLIDSEGNVVAVRRTDSEGRYSFADLPAGDYTVIATSYPPVTSTLTLDGGQAHEHNIELGYPEESNEQ